MRKNNAIPFTWHAFALIVSAYILLIAWVIFGAGCVAGTPVPRTVNEQIEAALIAAEKASGTIAALTCTRFDRAGDCIDPGKTFLPEHSLKMHSDVEQVVGALNTATLIDANSVGQCLGEERTQLSCLNAALVLLTEIDRQIIASKEAK